MKSDTVELICHKYILRNNQVMGGYVDYTLSTDYFSSIKAARGAIDGAATEYCFRVIKALPITKQTGDAAWALTRHERIMEEKCTNAYTVPG